MVECSFVWEYSTERLQNSVLALDDSDTVADTITELISFTDTFPNADSESSAYL